MSRKFVNVMKFLRIFKTNEKGRIKYNCYNPLSYVLVLACILMIIPVCSWVGVKEYLFEGNIFKY